MAKPGKGAHDWRHAFQKVHANRRDQLLRERGAALHGKPWHQIDREAREYATRSCETAINRENERRAIELKKRKLGQAL